MEILLFISNQFKKIRIKNEKNKIEKIKAKKKEIKKEKKS
jgi:hypothetical protein